MIVIEVLIAGYCLFMLGYLQIDQDKNMKKNRRRREGLVNIISK